MQSARPADKGPGDSGMTYTHAMLNGAVYCYHGYGRETYVAPDGRAWTRYDGVEKLWRATAKGSQCSPYREIRKILKGWIASWEKYCTNERYIRIFDTFWNSPEGCVSVVSDFAANGSL